MFPRVRTIAILVAVVSGLYFASQSEWGKKAMDHAMNTASGIEVDGIANFASDSSVVTNANTASYGSHAHHEIERLRRSNSDQYRYDEQLTSQLRGINADSDSSPQLVGSRVNDLREVIRFDISPDWLMHRFSRVSTVLADLQLEGLRVPMVTGTRADDLAGTLTYYFDRSGKLQRVTLHGFTGDPNRLIGTMTQHYGLIREPSLEAGVFTKRWNGKPVHFLRMTHAPVVHADAIHQKYTVFLELNQPNSAYGISREAQKIVHADRMSGRW